jgi:monovalent cation:H+ antiporter-2, CPA2 family
VILVALALASVAAGRLRLSAIPVFIVAGVLLGPEAPGIDLLHGTEGIQVISDLGIILLLFFLGLEFSLDRLTQARRLVGLGGAVDLAVNGTLGFALGALLLGPGIEAVLFGGLFYVSSSGIVTQALFDLRRLGDDETDLTLGVLVFEDLAIALFLAITGVLAAGGEVDAVGVAVTGIVALLFVGGFLLASRYADRALAPVVLRLSREQLFLGALAVAVGGAVLAEEAGVSEAVGALLAGVLLSGTEVRDQIEQQLLGLRDFAAAIFFFGFGLAVDPGGLGEVWHWLLAAVPLAVVGKALGGYLAGRVTGFSRRQGVNVGAALVARGEFTIILAQLAAAGVALDATFRGNVEAFAGVFVLATAIVGVLFMRESRRVGRLLFPATPTPRRRRAPGAQRHG